MYILRILHQYSIFKELRVTKNTVYLSMFYKNFSDFYCMWSLFLYIWQDIFHLFKILKPSIPIWIYRVISIITFLAFSITIYILKSINLHSKNENHDILMIWILEKQWNSFDTNQISDENSFRRRNDKSLL